MRCTRLAVCLGLATLLGSGLRALPLALAAPAFTLFESGQVRPLALAPDGQWLFAVNTPDNRLEVFYITGHGLEHRTSVPVGLEPVAVAARSANEVWVVNHLSDSVSVVVLDHGLQTGRVVRTLLVGDEPRDIVFARTWAEPGVYHHSAPWAARALRPAAHHTGGGASRRLGV